MRISIIRINLAYASVNDLGTILNLINNTKGYTVMNVTPSFMYDSYGSDTCCLVTCSMDDTARLKFCEQYIVARVDHYTSWPKETGTSTHTEAAWEQLKSVGGNAPLLILSREKVYKSSNEELRRYVREELNKQYNGNYDDVHIGLGQHGVTVDGDMFNCNAITSICAESGTESGRVGVLN